MRDADATDGWAGWGKTIQCSTLGHRGGPYGTVAEADTKDRRFAEEAERVQCIKKGNATERQEGAGGGINRGKQAGGQITEAD